MVEEGRMLLVVGLTSEIFLVSVETGKVKAKRFKESSNLISFVRIEERRKIIACNHDPGRLLVLRF